MIRIVLECVRILGAVDADTRHYNRERNLVSLIRMVRIVSECIRNEILIRKTIGYEVAVKINGWTNR